MIPNKPDQVHGIYGKPNSRDSHRRSPPIIDVSKLEPASMHGQIDGSRDETIHISVQLIVGKAWSEAKADSVRVTLKIRGDWWGASLKRRARQRMWSNMSGWGDRAILQVLGTRSSRCSTIEFMSRSVIRWVRFGAPMCVQSIAWWNWCGWKYSRHAQTHFQLFMSTLDAVSDHCSGVNSSSSAFNNSLSPAWSSMPFSGWSSRSSAEDGWSYGEGG